MTAYRHVALDDTAGENYYFAEVIVDDGSDFLRLRADDTCRATVELRMTVAETNTFIARLTEARAVADANRHS